MKLKLVNIILIFSLLLPSFTYSQSCSSEEETSTETESLDPIEGSTIGISDWKIEKTDISNKRGIGIIEIIGSYKDKSQKTVHFVEYHYYSKSNKLQILLTNNDKAKLKQDSITPNVQRFRDEYNI